MRRHQSFSMLFYHLKPYADMALTCLIRYTALNNYITSYGARTHIHYITLQYIALHYNTIQYNAIQYIHTYTHTYVYICMYRIHTSSQPPQVSMFLLLSPAMGTTAEDCPNPPRVVSLLRTCKTETIKVCGAGSCNCMGISPAEPTCSIHWPKKILWIIDIKNQTMCTSHST